MLGHGLAIDDAVLVVVAEGEGVLGLGALKGDSGNLVVHSIYFLSKRFQILSCPLVYELDGQHTVTVMSLLSRLYAPFGSLCNR
jgi:hypothetical protein